MYKVIVGMDNKSLLNNTGDVKPSQSLYSELKAIEENMINDTQTTITGGEDKPDEAQDKQIDNIESSWRGRLASFEKLFYGDERNYKSRIRQTSRATPTTLLERVSALFGGA